MLSAAAMPARIGFTRNSLPRRVRACDGALLFTIPTGPLPSELERAIHHRFAHKITVGPGFKREWFALDQSELEWLQNFARSGGHMPRKLVDTDALPLLPTFGEWRNNEAAPVSSEFEDWFSSLSPAEVLSSDTCLACGGVKKSGETLCCGCHSLVPPMAVSCFPPRVHNYLTHPVDAEPFKAALKAAVEIVADQREKRKASL